MFGSPRCLSQGIESKPGWHGFSTATAKNAQINVDSLDPARAGDGLDETLSET